MQSVAEGIYERLATVSFQLEEGSVDYEFLPRPGLLASSIPRSRHIHNYSGQTGAARATLMRSSRARTTPSKIGTASSLASHLSEHRFTNAEGVLETPPTVNFTSPVFACSFWFLSCTRTFHNSNDWRRHCLSHFKGEEPPNSVQCPLCDNFKYNGTDGWTAWNYRQSHLASHHLQGQPLSTSRPDFDLFQHLWRKRLINDQAYIRLIRGEYEPTHVEKYMSRNTRASRASRAFRPDRSVHNHISSDLLAQRVDESTTGNTKRLHHAIENLMVAPCEPPRIVDKRSESRKQLFEDDFDEHPDIKSTDWNHQSHCEGKAMPKSSIASFSAISATHTDLAKSSVDVDSANHKVATASAVMSLDNRQLYHQEIASSPSVVLSTGSREVVTDERSELLSVIDCSEVESESGSDSLLFESQSFGCSEDSNSVQSLEGLSTEVGSLRNIYVLMLIQSFCSTTRPPGAGESSSYENDTDELQTKGKGKHKVTSPPVQNAGQSRPSKRPSRRKNALSNGDDESDDQNNTAVPQDNRKSAVEDQRLFACPFVKRYPGRYFKCYGHNLKDVSRVKFHLFRDKAHRLPIYCPMCSMTFDGEDIRDEHIRAATCPRKPSIQWEGITSSQRQQLGKRSQTTISPEANWYALFSILFPEYPLPHSPYIDLSLSGELGVFREHMHAQGPQIWNSILDSRLPEELQPHLETLKSISDQFFPEAVERLCQTWTSQTSLTDSLASEAEPSTCVTPQLESGTERFHAILSGEDKHPVFQFDNLNSDVINRPMDDFSSPVLQIPRVNRSKQSEPEWVEPTWENDMSLYTSDLNLIDQPQEVSWNAANMDMDNNNNPAASVGMGELYDVLRLDQDESHSMNRISCDSVNKVST
jgi:hypothetical protein